MVQLLMCGVVEDFEIESQSKKDVILGDEQLLGGTPRL